MTEEFKGTSAVCASSDQECMNGSRAGVGVRAGQLRPDHRDSLAPEEAPGTGWAHSAAL